MHIGIPKPRREKKARRRIPRVSKKGRLTRKRDAKCKTQEGFDCQNTSSSTSQMKEIVMTNGRVTLIDDCDYELAMTYRWHESNSGYASYTQYLGIIDGKPRFRKLMLHRIILAPPSGMICDHINRNRLDNRRSNLRVCTLSDNARNSFHRPKSGRKGVYAAARGKWQAQIRIGPKLHSLGYYSDIEDAARAYDKAAREAYGEFACTNAA